MYMQTQSFEIDIKSKISNPKLSPGRMWWTMICAAVLMGLLQSAVGAETGSTKTSGVFYPPTLRERAKVNVEKYPWAAEIRENVVKAAQPWMELSDEHLWGLMFGPTIKRSWMVWSNGHCPACKASVPMYTWKMDALKRPWKVWCPHCSEQFPKNDFLKYYNSGLDQRGVFDPKLADRSLLFNTEHPDPSDPLHTFGVDDGEGYVEGDSRWRFIGAYLVYGQWKQAIVGGICKLAAAYTVTGDRAYAHKAGVLLDRVADLYPEFDFGTQGLVYEAPGSAGYVSTWHDACWEARQLAFAYDQVFDGIRQDPELVSFLSQKATQYGLANTKGSFSDIQNNIENRLLRDTVINRHKIQSNYPQTDFTVAVIQTVLGWPGNREEIREMLDGVISTATAVDGLTGEKGLAGYTALSPQAVASVLEQYARIDPRFLSDMLERHPRLYDCYRFFIDTWYQGKYYPNIGDSGVIARPNRSYSGVSFNRRPGLEPSAFSFMWRMYEATGDPAFAQVVYLGNGSTLDGLPFDLFAEDPDVFQSNIRRVVDRGTRLAASSINKQQWHLGVIRSGEGDDERMIVLDYDSTGNHGHADGMNLGLFAYGLDLIPDFGYPPVHHGGWSSPRSTWYMHTAAHNTVVVDGKRQEGCNGACTFWADGDDFSAIRASCAAMYGAKQYERTVAVVDVSADEFYVVDVFRVIGGADHAKFVRSGFGSISTHGVKLTPAESFYGLEHMRNLQADVSPAYGWSVDWTVEDRHKALAHPVDVHLKYTDLTTGAQCLIGESWVAMGYDNNVEAWIPHVMVRRTGDEPLSSTFVGIIEPYVARPAIKRSSRLDLTTLNGVAYPDSHVAVEVELKDGHKDLFIAADVEDPLVCTPVYDPRNAFVSDEHALVFSGEVCFVRLSAAGNVQQVALGRASSVKIGRLEVEVQPGTEYVEIVLEADHARVVSGRAADVKAVRIGGESIRVR